MIDRPIVFAIDANYIAPVRTAIASIARSMNGQSVHIVILHDGIDDATLRTLELESTSVEGREIHLPDIGIPVTEWVSKAAYFRMQAAEALPEYESCLYLDADTLVAGSIRALLERPTPHHAVAAVRDAQNPQLRFGDALPGWPALGFHPEREYFNSGVMLLNLELCRKIGFFERAWSFVAECPQHIRYWDQDALNWVSNDKWERLDRHWNTFTMSAILQTPGDHYAADELLPLSTLLEDELTARILHFTGPVKPWRPGFPDGRPNDLYRDAALYASRRTQGSYSANA